MDPFGDEGAFCRSRFWLLLSYVVACSSVVLGIWVLLHFYAWNAEVKDVWPGVACLFQVCCILGSALLFWVSRTPGDESGYGGYGSF